MSSPKEQGETPNRRARARREPSNPTPSVNMDELRELIALMRDNGLAELELEREEFRVRLRRDSDSGSSHAVAPPPAVPAPVHVPAPAPAPAPAPTSAAHPGAQAATAASLDQDLHIIPSPIVGTFYRSPS